MFLDIEEETQNDVITNAHTLMVEHALENSDKYKEMISKKTGCKL
jgi:hypothetical protein